MMHFLTPFLVLLSFFHLSSVGSSSSVKDLLRVNDFQDHFDFGPLDLERGVADRTLGERERELDSKPKCTTCPSPFAPGSTTTNPCYGTGNTVVTYNSPTSFQPPTLRIPSCSSVVSGKYWGKPIVDPKCGKLTDVACDASNFKCRLPEFEDCVKEVVNGVPYCSFSCSSGGSLFTSPDFKFTVDASGTVTFISVATFGVKALGLQEGNGFCLYTADTTLTTTSFGLPGGEDELDKGIACLTCSIQRTTQGPTEPVCADATGIQLSVTDANVGDSFTWTLPGGAVLPQTSSSVSVDASQLGGTGDKVVTVKITDGSGKCSKSLTITVTVQDCGVPLVCPTDPDPTSTTLPPPLVIISDTILKVSGDVSCAKQSAIVVVLKATLTVQVSSSATLSKLKFVAEEGVINFVGVGSGITLTLADNDGSNFRFEFNAGPPSNARYVLTSSSGGAMIAVDTIHVKNMAMTFANNFAADAAAFLVFFLPSSKLTFDGSVKFTGNTVAPPSDPNFQPMKEFSNFGLLEFKGSVEFDFGQPTENDIFNDPDGGVITCTSAFIPAAFKGTTGYTGIADACFLA